MTDVGPIPVVNMSQRTIMQHLSLTDCKPASHLPVPVGETALDRMQKLGWIERRGTEPRTEIRLTQSGLEAMRAPLNEARKK